MEIKYRELTPTESAAQRCAIMLPSRLQCPERASYKAVGDSVNLLICKHHLQVEMQLQSAMTFVLVDENNQPVDDKPAIQSS
jgi:hypothetical protein